MSDNESNGIPDKWNAGTILAKANELSRRLRNWHIEDCRFPTQFASERESRRWVRLTFREIITRVNENPTPRPDKSLQFYLNMADEPNENECIGEVYENPESDTDRSLTMWLMGDFFRHLLGFSRQPVVDYLIDTYGHLLDLSAWTIRGPRSDEPWPTQLGPDQQGAARSYMVIGRIVPSEILDNFTKAAEKLLTLNDGQLDASRFEMATANRVHIDDVDSYTLSRESAFHTSFHELAFELLGIEGLPLPRTNWHLHKGQDGYDDPYLTDEDYQALGNIICEHVPGMTVQTWRDSTLGQRVALLRHSIEKLRHTVPDKEPNNMTQKSDSKTRRPDLLLVTVNEHETKAVLAAFQEATGLAAKAISIDGRVYNDLGAVNGTTVFHALSEMGPAGVGGMQQTVDKAIRALQPAAVIAVGIAFGVDKKKQGVGDILICNQLQPYDLERIGDVRILRDDKPHATARLINHFAVFAQAAWEGPAVERGVVLSGAKLIDNFDYRQQLLNLVPEAIGGEMEGAGLYVPCQEHKVDWIVVKAISDWADGKKRREKEKRQKLAATNAITFVISSLEYAPLQLQGSNVSPHTTDLADSPFSEYESWATGDWQVDQQLRQLAEYHPTQDQDSEQLLRLMRPLFQRAAFYPEPEGDWLSFAYVVMATRFLVQDSLAAVVDNQLRKQIRAVVKALAGLQTFVQKVIGPSVTLSQHAEQFIRDKREFVDQLHTRAKWEYVFNDPKRAEIIYKSNSERIQLISALELKLQAAGLL